MANVVRIELDHAGIKALLNSNEVRDCIEEKAREIAGRCGSGYAAADPHHTGERIAVNIYPATAEARQDNYDNNTLKRELFR